MPKKAKAGKGKKGKGGAKAEGEGGGDVEAASTEELNSKITTLEKEKNKEEEYRNYMQLERDKVNAFWEITKKDLEDKKAELRNKDREMEEMEERHQVEIKVYKQKVKHLLYEHQNNITTLKADGEMALKLQQDEFAKREDELQQDKRSLKLDLKEMELAHEDVVRQLKLDNAKEITKLRQEFELNARELQNKYEKKMKMLRDDLELRRKQEIHEIEERKNTHINELMKKHEKAFADIKNYYNDITHNNLDLIKTLKEDVAEMKKKEAQNEKLMTEIAQENKRLSEPLQKALKEVEMQRHQLANYEKDKTSLHLTKQRLVDTDKQLKNLEWDHEVITQRFAQVQKERDELYEKFESSIYDVQQKSGLKNLMLERKLTALSEQLEKKEAQLGEVLAASNLDQTTLQQVTKKLDEVLDSKNQLIKALQYDVAKVSKAHNDLIRVYEAKLAEFGVPVEELGFRPLITNTSPGPAGLVVGA
uniref:Growth arrest-specific protein 8 domain-containing protein n=1 Tax=Pyramimonas obovata TaxID=1411642 RepID=A0A7S0N549_9CHLO|mmetsp:Transcript_19771/g.43224  ORF Transcript_19771/g.43224 Transcript_19771/m.43224 type:complete len:477 (+) Transcript_19771:245-1675(+)|eukprot:CAMPEP_0118923490 /NCGR_PEP_ID=MMETSP1169-20130426/1987_1 /TAXON_ID=36882 /ORGANISM="Pyramimonas obovata, Strain CCMP722" /LENGTH=476 /DNA_ID=CAMNT_0006864475 /DNA_START=230 /DNA_END=1660 /DNA_ORIENTATION=+